MPEAQPLEAQAAAAPTWWVEPFTDDERAALAPYVTNTDRPVFALRNLPEVVKGALFARYSRTGKSLRRLLLDEFVAADGPVDAVRPEPDVVPGRPSPGAPDGSDAGRSGTGGRVPGPRVPDTGRAEALYTRVLDEYGDDSVAQLGGAHVAVEQASNVLTKLLERGRLASYLEQSTRYVPYTDRPGGRWRCHVDPDVDAGPVGPYYRTTMDGLFTEYTALLAEVQGYLERAAPRDPAVPENAWRRALRARALDAVRGVLPAAATSNVGIYASGQAYEALVLRLRAHPLPEARAAADLLLTELRQVIPAFLRRVDRPERGGAWVEYLARTAADADTAVADLLGAGPAPSLPASEDAPDGSFVRLVDHDPEGERKILAAIVWEHAAVDAATAHRRVAGLTAEDRARLLGAYTGARANRRHRPGRAFEQAVYTFEIVADYGAFRDLQRHRIGTVTWQSLVPDLGYEVPSDVDAAGVGDRFRAAMRASAALHRELLTAGLTAQAPYAVTLAHRVRFFMTLNARALMHVTELRSAPQGHPAYRFVAQEMHRLLAEEAGHRLLADTMRFVVHDEPASGGGLGRLTAEQRTERRRSPRG